MINPQEVVIGRYFFLARRLPEPVDLDGRSVYIHHPSKLVDATAACVCYRGVQDNIPLQPRHVILRRSAHYYNHSEGGLSRYTFDMITRVPILIQPRHDEISQCLEQLENDPLFTLTFKRRIPS